MAGQINDIGDNSVCSSMSMQTQGTVSGGNAHLGNLDIREQQLSMILMLYKQELLNT